MTKQREAPIGIFDSGIGGISIWKEIQKVLPLEDTIYLSDSANAPYGQKNRETIIQFSVKNTDYLLAKGCKLIVVACNTATTNAIQTLRKKYPSISFIGIEPAIKPAALHTKTNSIGVLATKGTLNSALFEKTAATLKSTISVTEQIGEGLVELIEAGKIETPEMNRLLKTYLAPMQAANVDCIVLGCSHYPYLKKQIEQITGGEIRIIDSGYAVANQTKKILTEQKLNRFTNTKPSYTFLCNKNSALIKEIVKEYKNVTISTTNF
ncbi:glutamate racemase [Tenacibaculum sp. SG-28]|uniref:glutamate racemase n=1 Tax=Tenacibaculum sp. SG-28 TaxID=754426 RepID=UPI000CF39606|nr:glutamate racemase [Tenacibaculum sp. SG-28]PQJ22793.1 glutamate racemase [Tenacibaculum sp. SG-28]